jgi:hypothetical protein
MKYYFLLDGFTEAREISKDFYNWIRESHLTSFPRIVVLIKVKLK